MTDNIYKKKYLKYKKKYLKLKELKGGFKFFDLVAPKRINDITKKHDEEIDKVDSENDFIDKYKEQNQGIENKLEEEIEKVDEEDDLEDLYEDQVDEVNDHAKEQKDEITEIKEDLINNIFGLDDEENKDDKESKDEENKDEEKKPEKNNN